MDNIEREEQICPLTQEPCMGTKCAVAVEVDHYTVDPYAKIYYCGLASTYDIYTYGKPCVIDYKQHIKEI